MRAGFIFLLLFLLFVPSTYAATISHTTTKTSIGIDEDIELDVNLTIQAGDGNEYFLRGVFYKPGDNNYCGFTWNGSTWFSGPYSTQEQWKNFQKITITSNSWNGKVRLKIDPEDTGCKDSGEYKIKLQRFTLSGAGTFDDQNETSLSVTVPTATPTPSPTQQNTPTPKVTRAPTQSPTTNLSQATSMTGTDTLTIKSTMSDEENIARTKELLSDKNVYATTSVSKTTKSTPKVLGKSITGDNEKVKEKAKETEKKKKGNTFVYVGGLCLILACGILLYQTYRNRDEQ